jgi:thioredoxin reductase
MARIEVPRIAILGAGPIGLEAALYARRLGLNVTVYERGRVGEHVLRWGHVRLFSPFGMNSTRLGRATLSAEHPDNTLPAETDCIIGKEHVAAYLEPLAKTTLLAGCMRTETALLGVARRGLLKSESPGEDKRAKQPFRLLFRAAKGQEYVEEADVVLDCTGTYGQHRWLGDGGVPAIGEQSAETQIAYHLEDVGGDRRSVYSGRTILVIGAGYSAATSVCALADLAEKQSDTWVIWLARGPGTQPIRRLANDPLKERDRLAVRANTFATRPEGNVEFHPQTVVESIESAGPDKGFRVGTRAGAKTRTWEVDRIMAHVGYTPDTTLYRELQVHECYASLGPMKLAAALQTQAGTDCLRLTVRGAELLRNPEPNFFILGAKSYGRNSHFLLRAGFEQIRDVFTLITGKPTLDLYKNASP